MFTKGRRTERIVNGDMKVGGIVLERKKDLNRRDSHWRRAGHGATAPTRTLGGCETLGSQALPSGGEEVVSGI